MWWILGAIGAGGALGWLLKKKATPPTPPPAPGQTLSRSAALASQSYALENVTNPVTLLDLAEQLSGYGHADLALPLVLKAATYAHVPGGAQT